MASRPPLDIARPRGILGLPQQQRFRASPLAPLGGGLDFGFSATGFGSPQVPGMGLDFGNPIFGSGAPIGQQIFGRSPEEEAILDAPDSFFAGGTQEEREQNRQAAIEAVRERQRERAQQQPAGGGIQGLLSPNPGAPAPPPQPAQQGGLLSDDPRLIDRLAGFDSGTLFGAIGRLAGGRTAAERASLAAQRQRIARQGAVRSFVDQFTQSPAGASLTPAQSEFLRTAAQVDPAGAVGQVGGILFPDPQRARGLEGRFEALERRLGRQLSEEEILQLGGVGPEPNENLDVPIPVSQLSGIRLPDGSTPPIGTTFRQAQAAGAGVQTGQEQTRVAEADAALAVLDQLEDLAVGDDGVLRGVEPGLLNRASAGLDFGLSLLTQDDPRASLFRDLRQGTISRFIRTLGERGALSDGDVARAEGLLPRIFPLPDSGPVASQKIQDLRGIINQGIANLNREQGAETPTEPAADTAAPDTPRRFRFNPETGRLEPIL